jgi:hypothetical protein
MKTKLLISKQTICDFSETKTNSAVTVWTAYKVVTVWTA